MHWNYTKVHFVASIFYAHLNSNLLSYSLLYVIMMKIIYDKKMWVKNEGTNCCKKYRHMGIDKISEDKIWTPWWKKVRNRINVIPWLLWKVIKVLLFDKTIAFVEKP